MKRTLGILLSIYVVVIVMMLSCQRGNKHMHTESCKLTTINKNELP